jgi:glyoxylase-like metal-dependent hydrolase (beta-lactamase superfamily II)
MTDAQADVKDDVAHCRSPATRWQITTPNPADSQGELVRGEDAAHGGGMRRFLVLLSTLAACAEGRPIPTSVAPHIEQVASPAEGIFANAYLIETAGGVVLIDTTLRVSDANALRARVVATGKPLLGVLLTHGHPDHYNGAAIVTEGLDVPVIATRDVDRVIRADDAAKEQLWKPMFGAEWPARRAFPTRLVADGEVVPLGGLDFRVHALGPAESHADSYWTIDGVPAAFVGDLVFSETHSFLTDAHIGAWLDALDRLASALPAGATVYPGHGKPGDMRLIATERRYLERLRTEIRRLSPDGAPLSDAAKAELLAALKQVEPGVALEFLVGLGADAVARELAGP